MPMKPITIMVATTRSYRLPALRADEPAPSLSSSEALANAPDVGDGHFRVPQVLDE